MSWHCSAVLLFCADDSVVAVEDAVEVVASEDVAAEVATEALLPGNTTGVSELEDDVTGTGLVDGVELDTLSLEELFSTGVVIVELWVVMLLAASEESVLPERLLLLRLLFPEPPQAINTLEIKISALGFNPPIMTSVRWVTFIFTTFYLCLNFFGLYCRVLKASKKCEGFWR